MNRDTTTPPELNDALLARLPLFPLQNAVLFPNAVIPLHFFEPRYRLLAQHCVEGSRVMVLGALEGDGSLDVNGPDLARDSTVEGRPTVRSIVTIGAIAGERRLPDGRWDIALKGICRAEIIGEHASSEPYRQIQVRRLRDRERPDDRIRSAELRSTVVQLANLLPALWPQLNPMLMDARTPGALADIVAALFVDDHGLRRTLLEELRVGQRIELLNDALAGVMLDLTLRARDNDVGARGPFH